MSQRGQNQGEPSSLLKVSEHCPDPLELFRRLCDGGLRPDTLLLESGDTETHWGEKSLLVLRSALRIECRGQQVWIRALNSNGARLLPWLASRLIPEASVLQQLPHYLHLRYPPPPRGSEEQRLRAPSPTDVLRTVVRAPRCLAGQDELGSLVAGVFSYDLVGVYESLPPSRSEGLPWADYEFWLPDQLIWLHHRRSSSTIVAHVYGEDHCSRLEDEARREIERIAVACESLAGEKGRGAASRAARFAKAPWLQRREPAVALAGSKGGVAVTADMTDAQFARLVETLKGHIVAGDVFQIVPSRTFSIPCTDPVAVYRRLRDLNPSPYMFFANGSSGVLFGASPETAIKVHGKPLQVEIRPIAGTRPRGLRSDGSVDVELDVRLEAELRLNEKELAEHMMLVDLARNDVARVSEAGTRFVDRLLSVERYSHVMHLVSHVIGRLREDLDALHAYVATMNMGTLVGAPKLKAAELLRRYESSRRGPYGGAIGYFTRDGQMDTCIIIRSAVVQKGTAHVRVGAGVVHDSDPMAEAKETRRKAEAVLQAIREAENA